MHHAQDDLRLAQLLVDERLQRAERARLARDARQRTAGQGDGSAAWLTAISRKLRPGPALRPDSAPRIEPCANC